MEELSQLERSTEHDFDTESTDLDMRPGHPISQTRIIEGARQWSTQAKTGDWLNHVPQLATPTPDESVSKETRRPQWDITTQMNLRPPAEPSRGMGDLTEAGQRQLFLAVAFLVAASAGLATGMLLTFVWS